MGTQAYPLRIPEGIVDLARLRSSDEHVDQSTALRQLLHLGAEEYVLRLVESGRISIGKATKLLNISIHDIYIVAERHGVRLGATSEQQTKSIQTAKKLFKLS